MSKHISVLVDMHHNVEHWRPYKFHFKDKGDASDNIAYAIQQGIFKEGDEMGWFDGFGGDALDKNEIKKVARELSETGGERVVYFRNEDGSVNENHGLAIWFTHDFNSQNIGFGEAHRSELHPKKGPLTGEDTNKYDNKWLVIEKKDEAKKAMTAIVNKVKAKSAAKKKVAKKKAKQ